MNFPFLKAVAFIIIIIINLFLILIWGFPVRSLRAPRAPLLKMVNRNQVHIAKSQWEHDTL